jgi:hypothetical protein
MRMLITTIALLALVDSSAAIAQTAGSRNPAGPPLMAQEQQSWASIALLGHYDSRPASGGRRFTTIQADLVSLTWLSGQPR